MLWIIAACVTAGVLSLAAAAALSFSVLQAWRPRMVGFAVGVLLGSAFLHLLPEAFEQADNMSRLFAVTLTGVMGFFVLERLLAWRHDHRATGGAVPTRRRVIGPLIVVGDGIHNFADGILIAGAFLADAALGVAATAAILAHEVPQEVGDFMLLLHAGYSRRKALLLNVASSLASIAGAIIGYLALSRVEAVIPYTLALAAASFIYIATVNLMPYLHEHFDGPSTVWHIVLMATGVGTIGGMYALAHGLAHSH